LTQATLELRGGALELRARGRRLEGYAALFGVDAKLGPVIETIAPGAFREALASKRDIIALQDHDAHRLLGRTASGTLGLTEDAKGLGFDLSVPDTHAGRDVLALAERGDLGGMSFGFRMRPNGETWDGSRRTLVNIDLVEISVVSSFAAYPQTGETVSARNAPQPVRLALARRRLLIAEAGG
jgi:HK97 family phage prohead protease